MSVSPEPGREIFARMEAVLTMPFPTVVAELVEALGGGMTAVIAGVKLTSELREYMDGKRMARTEEREGRLRLALQAVRALQFQIGYEAIRQWMLGANQHLGYRAPVGFFAKKSLEEAGLRVLPAALAFLGDIGSQIPRPAPRLSRLEQSSRPHR